MVQSTSDFIFKNRDDLVKFLVFYDIYRTMNGKSTLLQLLHLPPNPDIPFDTNYNSYCGKMPSSYHTDDEVRGFLLGNWHPFIITTLRPLL